MSTTVSYLPLTWAKTNDTPTAMSFVTALSPGRQLNSLTSFTPDYVTVRQAFNDLLVFPHLKAIKIEDNSKSNLLSLITNGNSQFSELSNIAIELARKVISYDATFSVLVGALNIQLLVMTLQPVAQEYADHAQAESKVNLKIFADISHPSWSINISLLMMIWCLVYRLYCFCQFVYRQSGHSISAAQCTNTSTE